MSRRTCPRTFSNVVCCRTHRARWRSWAPRARPRAMRISACAASISPTRRKVEPSLLRTPTMLGTWVTRSSSGRVSSRISRARGSDRLRFEPWPARWLGGSCRRRLVPPAEAERAPHAEPRGRCSAAGGAGLPPIRVRAVAPLRRRLRAPRPRLRGLAELGAGTPCADRDRPRSGPAGRWPLRRRLGVLRSRCRRTRRGPGPMPVHTPSP